MAPPTRKSVLQLYHAMLRTSKSFSSYNFREYFVRRTGETFRQIQSESDPQKASALYSQAVKDYNVLKRSAIVNQLYGGWKLVVENQKPQRNRGDT